MSNEDLGYVPNFKNFDFLQVIGEARLLIIGPLPSQITRLANQFGIQVRHLLLPSHEMSALPEGMYFGTAERYPFYLIWNGGQPPSSQISSQERSVENHDPLFIAKSVHMDNWEKGKPLQSSEKYSVNEPVTIVGGTGADARGVIQEIQPFPDGIRYRVLTNGRVVNRTESGIAKFQGRTDDPASWINERPSDHKSISTTLTSIKMRHPLTDMVYSFSTSKTLFRAYQFKPVLKILSNEKNRILIADEVGLGKTIEAGLVWTELEQRNNLRRVLVVVPANLRDKWQTELRRRFDRDVNVLTRDDLSRFLDDLDAGLDPDLIGIIGIETMRTYPRLDELATKWPRLDLVIIDEAHSLRNTGTKTSALGSLLSDISDSLVFLSATPINLRTSDLFNLLNMLDEGEFPDLVEFEEQLKPTQVLNKAASQLIAAGTVDKSSIIKNLRSMNDMTYGQFITQHPDFDDVTTLLGQDDELNHEDIAAIRRKLSNLSPLSSLLTRTRKVDVPGDKAVREPRNLQVSWSSAESAYYKTLQDTLTAEVMARGGIPGFELQMPLRQAASCLPASIALMKDKRGVDPDLIDDYDDLELPKVNLIDSFSPDLERILSSWDLSKNIDTKYDNLLFALNNLPASEEHNDRQAIPVLLFSFFRPTLEYLKNRLTSDGKRVGLMYGKTPMEDRKKIMKDFREGKFDILLVSEVGSEGLDFEFCNVLVNYDLPWNPMRVEQRIGRLDRFGQKSKKIFIFNLEIPETIEAQIIGRLYNRIDIFRLALGDIEPILGEVDSLLRMSLDPSLSPDQKKQRQEEIMIAIEARLMDLSDLEENRGNLLGLDAAAIEGFTDSTPGAGKYIGELELKNFLEYGLTRYKSKIKPGSIPGTYRLEGTQALADDLIRHKEFKEGTSLGRDRLIQLCRDGEWIEITFKSDLASREDTEMMSIRHPIARVVEIAMRSGLALERFGAVSLDGLESHETYLMAVNLASSSGTRPLLELWPVVVRLSDLTVVEQIGDIALQALSDGTLSEWIGKMPSTDLLEGALRVADEHLFIRQQREEKRAQAANLSLVSNRQRNVERQIERKIESATRRLAEVPDERIQKMAKAQIRNLERDRQDKIAELEKQKSLAMSVEQLAFVLIKGSGSKS